MTKQRPMVLLSLFVMVFGGVTGCDRMLPFSFSVPVDLGTYDVGALLSAGGAAGPAIPVCSLPTNDDIEKMARDNLGDLVGNLIEVDAMDLSNVTLTALQGDFTFVTSLGLQWQPKPLNGVAQPPVDLGTVADAQGFGDEIVITPADPVDFLALINDNEDNPASGCPSLNMDFTGALPEPSQAPVVHGVATLEVTGHVQL